MTTPVSRERRFSTYTLTDKQNTLDAETTHPATEAKKETKPIQYCKVISLQLKEIDLNLKISK